MGEVSSQGNGMEAENHGFPDMEHISEITHRNRLNVVRKKRINKVQAGPKVKKTRFYDRENKFNILNHEFNHEDTRSMILFMGVPRIW